MLSFPPEILLLILENACSFADLRALLLTSPIFNELWKRHMSSVSSVVIERSLVSYPEVSQASSDVSPHTIQNISLEPE